MPTKINNRQYTLLAIFAILSSKMMSLPHVIYQFASNDSIWSIILNVLIELLLLLLITRLIYRHPNMHFYQYLSSRITRIGAILVIIPICIFLFLKALCILQETYSFLLHTIYRQLSPLCFFIPALFVTGYLSTKGALTISKSVEIFVFFVAIGLLTAFVNTFGIVPIDTNLPYFQNGLISTLNGTYHSCFYIGNSLALLFFMGKIDIRPHLVPNTLIWSSIVALFVVLMDYSFYNMLGNTVIYSQFAISDMSQFNPFVSDLGHLNWLSIIVSTVNLLSIVSISFYGIRTAISQIFHIPNTTWIFVLMSIIIYISCSFIHFDIAVLVQYATSFGKFIAIPILSIITILLIILNCQKRSNYDENSPDQISNNMYSRLYSHTHTH